MKPFVLSMAAALFMLTSANAQSLQQEQWRTQSQIRRGLRDGSLTPREARRLEREQVRLNRKAMRKAYDGNGLTFRERQQLRRDQERLNREVRRERRDGEYQRY